MDEREKVTKKKKREQDSTEDEKVQDELNWNYISSDAAAFNAL
jgi:hypothetical protein